MTLREDPYESQLAGSAVVLLCNLGNTVDEFQVFGEVFSRETRRETAIIGFLEVIRAADLTTEHTAAKGRICDNSNPKLPSGFEKADLLRLDIEAEGRVPGRLCQLRVLLCIMQV